MICDECETVAHCSKHGCIPKHQALDKMAENARELGLDYEQYKDAIEVSVIFHEGQRMFAVPKQPAQQQEPVAWKHDCAALLTNDVELWIDQCPHCGKPRTSPPAQRTWVGLTDEERNVINRHNVYVSDIISATEAKLRSKNEDRN